MKTEETEEWCTIESVPNYEVSSFGNFRRKDGKPIKQWKTNWGYMQTQFNTTKKQNCHRLVATCFCPNPNNYPFVNHKNSIKHDNRASNLEWCTQSQNLKHAFKFGFKSIDGERHPSAKFTDSKVSLVRHMKSTGIKSSEIAKELGIDVKSVYYIVSRQTWKHL